MSVIVNKLLNSEPETQAVIVSKLIDSQIKEILDFTTKSAPEKTVIIAKSLLTALRQNPESNHDKRKVVFLTLLNFLKTGLGSADQSSDALSLIVGEIHFLKSGEIESVLERYADALESEESFGTRWFDAFFPLMQALVSPASSDGDKIGEESSVAKTRIIEKICEAKWSTIGRVKILSVFREIPLNGAELKMVSTRVVKELKRVATDDLPSYVYQLLHFAALVKSQSIIQSLIFYLCTLAEQLTSSKDDADTNNSSLKEALGTIILHFIYIARQNQETGQCLLNSFKDTCFEISFFKLALVLAISRTMRFHEQAILAVKNAVLQCLKVDVRRRSSAWLQNTLPAACDIEARVKSFLKQGTFGWEHVIESLCEVGFEILESTFNGKSTKTSPVSSNWTQTFQRRCSHVAKMILIQCFKAEHSIRSTVVDKVLDSIALHPTRGLINLFAALVKTAPHSVMENRAKIVEALSLVTVLPSDVSILFLEALFVIVELCPQIRDALFPMLKNGIFSKEPNARRVAVNGFVLFLDRFRIINSLMSSQSSQFSQTFPTFSSSQASINLPSGSQQTTIETMGLEIIGCLQRALLQDGATRESLYMGFCTLVTRNHVFIEPIVDVLLPHFEQYLEMSGGEPVRVNLEKCVASSKERVSLTEPLGVLVHCFTVCVQLSADPYPDSGAVVHAPKYQADFPLTKLKQNLDVLCEKMKGAELEDFNLDKSASYAPGEKMGLRNFYMASVLLSILEALLEYSLETKQLNLASAETVLKLFNLHAETVTLLKEKAANGTKKQSATWPQFAKNVLLPDRLSHLISFTCLRRVLVDLLTEQGETDREAFQLLRQHSEFCKWVLSYVESYCRDDERGSGARLSLDDISSVARLTLLFYRQGDGLAKDLKEQTVRSLVTMSLEVFCLCVQLVYKHYREKLYDLMVLLAPVLEIDQLKTGVSEFAYLYFRIWMKLIIRMLSDLDDKNSHEGKESLKKEVSTMFEIAKTFSEFIQNSDSELSGCYSVVLRVCSEQSVANPLQAKLLWELLFSMRYIVEPFPTTLTSITEGLHFFLDDVTDGSELPAPQRVYASLSSSAAPIVLKSLLDHVEKILDDAKYATSHLRLLLVTGDRAKLSKDESAERESSSDLFYKLESSVCDLFACLVNVLHEIVQSRIPRLLLDLSLRQLSRFYVEMTAFVKLHALLWSKTAASTPKFEKLVSRSGTHVTPYIYQLLTHFQLAEEQSFLNKTGVQKYAVITKSKVIREMKNVSMLIFAIENFENQLIRLGAKCKVDFMKNVKPSTNRDFRIDVDRVRCAVAEVQQEDDSLADEDVENSESDGDEETKPKKRRS